jgi:hypothetical protein
MTPQAQNFSDRFGNCADEVAAGTGLNRWALLVQWAVETGTGSQVFGNNLGNIRCSSTSFCQYASLDDFAQHAISVWHSPWPPPIEPWRAAAAGQPMQTQLVAFGESPWDAGHYNNGGGPGSSLIAVWQQEFGGIGDPVVPVIKPRRSITIMAQTSLHQFGRGAANPSDGKRNLWHRKWDESIPGWGPETDLGGNVGVDDLGGEEISGGSPAPGVIVVTVIGGDGKIYDISSRDDGANFSVFSGPSGILDGLFTIGGGSVTAQPTVGGLTAAQDSTLTAAGAAAAAAQTAAETVLADLRGGLKGA